MKSYFIFAIALTVAYVIYYAVIIVQDLYGKKSSEKTEEEVFDLGGPEEQEKSVDVTENETGFSVGGEKYETEIQPTTSPETEAENKEQEETAARERFERMKAKAEERMEETVPYLSDARTAEEMYKSMIARGRMENRPDMEWQPVKNKL
ncbi:MAG: hypothetical protein Q4F50_07790 [Bacteroides sp.]|uniref:hypothetical protein n=1 Tax=Bacteroides sp. TaxID=29523 RepID=UPI0026E031B7|nr:hypothetical protein [Bacteroides sp.]MDO5419948.1 hypothetical protein [Bacteroides sp.]